MLESKQGSNRLSANGTCNTVQVLRRSSDLLGPGLALRSHRSHDSEMNLAPFSASVMPYWALKCKISSFSA